jgi:chromatin segregation and condensation protein Rec8/ScpA/Scc1 (kleisin family)
VDLGCHFAELGWRPGTTMVDLKISLPLYEGPLELLLDLIRRQKLDIYDIPIAKITEQYLDYLHLMEDLNVDVASDFIVIAAQLIYIKSRMLLPPDPDAVPEEQEDPRAELVRRLLEYEKFKNAAQMLYQREMVENAAWSNPGSIAMEDSELEPEMAVTVYDLLLVFRDALKRAEQRPRGVLGRADDGVSFRKDHVRVGQRGAIRRSARNHIAACLDYGIPGASGANAASRHLPQTGQSFWRNHCSSQSEL